jgi:sulfotransferase
MKDFVFLSGLPRTGSTLLGSLLSQHPSLHSSSTSIIRDLIVNVKGYYLGESPYFKVKDLNSPVWRIMRHILYGAYEHINKPIIVEKDRNWSKDIMFIEKLINKKPKIIAPVRPISEILSSFILLSERIEYVSKIDEEVLKYKRELNHRNRCRILWEKYIYGSWRSLKSGYECNPECFLILDYNDIVNNPIKIVNKICKFLNIDNYEVEIKNIVNISPEDDHVYGLPGLHELRSEIKRTSPEAEEVLGSDLFNFWSEKKLEFWVNNWQEIDYLH